MTQRRPGRKPDSVPFMARKFWAKVAIGPDCWEWRGRKESNGYGQSTRWDGLPGRAHRVAWWLVFGEVPPAGQCVLHKCDNPLCVKPSHLYLGTHKQNAADRESRGRHKAAKGHRIASSTFTEDHVLQIRAWREQGWSLGRIARFFGVPASTIWRFVTDGPYRSWKHLDQGRSDEPTPS